MVRNRQFGEGVGSVAPLPADDDFRRDLKNPDGKAPVAQVLAGPGECAAAGPEQPSDNVSWYDYLWNNSLWTKKLWKWISIQIIWIKNFEKNQLIKYISWFAGPSLKYLTLEDPSFFHFIILGGPNA